jgi:hypothetical protein
VRSSRSGGIFPPQPSPVSERLNFKIRFHLEIAKSHALHRFADHFQHFHDFRVVRPPEIPQRNTLESDSRQLGSAFFEYCFQVPANRIGSYEFNTAQLKTIQEVITLTVFAVFSVTYLGEKPKWNHAASAGCLILGVFFVFHKW